MNKKRTIPQVIRELPTDELREIIRSLGNMTWEEDAPLRDLTKKIYDKEDVMVMQMLTLSIPLAIELENRMS